MRKYLQGTLDFACGIYAVINAAACTHGLDLASARRIFSETCITLAGRPPLWEAVCRNQTDHYWLVRHMLARWCGEAPHALDAHAPFAESTVPSAADRDLEAVSLWLPEKEAPGGPPSRAASEKEAESAHGEICRWLSGKKPGKRTAVLRFHRFLPAFPEPVVSHWTTARLMAGGDILLHDASSETNALQMLEERALLPPGGGRALVRIVPESIFLLEKKTARLFL